MSGATLPGPYFSKLVPKEAGPWDGCPGGHVHRAPVTSRGFVAAVHQLKGQWPYETLVRVWLDALMASMRRMAY